MCIAIFVHAYRCCLDITLNWYKSKFTPFRTLYLENQFGQANAKLTHKHKHKDSSQHVHHRSPVKHQLSHLHKVSGESGKAGKFTPKVAVKPPPLLV